MTLKDIKNKEVTVMGLGRMGGGVETVKFLARHGANVLVTDIKKAQDLEESLAQLKGLARIEFALGHHRKEDFIEKDFIVKNPGVPANSPYLRLAQDHHVPIETDVSLFFKLSPASIIGVTGTKGKSTTATLIYELLKRRYAAFLAGNIGMTPLKILEEVDANSLIVLELSSWQLEDLAPFKVAPHVSVVTNIYQDHLDRHNDMAQYVEAKKGILYFATKDDSVVLNDDDAQVRSFAAHTKGKVYYYSLTHPVNGAFLTDGNFYFDDQEDAIVSLDQVALKGKHNAANVAAAITVAKLYKLKNKDIQFVLAQFSGIPFRQEMVREVNGVQFINDTTATNPAATLACLERFAGGIFIVGGVDKHLDYSELAEAMGKYARLLILLPGSASDKIALGLRVKGLGLRVKEVTNMEEAVSEAFASAKPGDTVVLSPGAASFNLFKNEFDRGKKFNEIVNSL